MTWSDVEMRQAKKTLAKGVEGARSNIPEYNTESSESRGKEFVRRFYVIIHCGISLSEPWFFPCWPLVILTGEFSQR